MVTSSTALRYKEDGSGLVTHSGRNASQNPYELSKFVELLQAEKVSSYLEIGARHGDTFFDVMRSLPRGSRGLAVDMPGGNWGTHKSRTHLLRVCSELSKLGYQVECLFANSQLDATAEMIAAHGAFDAALIDGDHLYEGVKRDWDLYQRCARIVAFHDIAGDGQTQRRTNLPVEVPRLWSEIKASNLRHVEFIDTDSCMGIGVVWVR